MRVVEARNLWKEYRLRRQTVPALRGVTLNVKEGEFLVLWGPSGSGKTTLLNLLGGLDQPTQGEVWVAEQPLHRLPERERCRLRSSTVGYIFQAFNLLPVLTAYENVEYPLLLLGVHPRERRRRVREVLERVGLAELADRRPEELSAGQCQRVAIARALVTRPKVVLADEPTANLDSETGRQVLRLMRALTREDSTAYVVATHDPRVEGEADRVLRLRDGVLERERRWEWEEGKP